MYQAFGPGRFRSRLATIAAGTILGTGDRAGGFLHLRFLASAVLASSGEPAIGRALPFGQQVSCSVFPRKWVKAQRLGRVGASRCLGGDVVRLLF